MVTGEIRITDNLEELLDILPADIAGSLRNAKELNELIEVVMDLGRRPEARFEGHFTYLREEFVTTKDIKFTVDRVGRFASDNRAGIERTLHRISAIKNRTDDIVGLTMRVGRAVYGTINLIRDLLETDKSILIMGRPGVGKTTMLREMARVLADDFQKRVVIVDTSNEIAGNGDIPHPGIGLARRMQVKHHDLQHEVMIEAVQNHMPQVIVVDEIGTEKEAYAARTIAERGVQLIATAHGNNLANLLMNPTLSDLIGGIQPVTLSDEEARKRHTQKTVLERKSPPTFDIIIEIIEKDKLAIHHKVDEVVDAILRGYTPKPEIRTWDDAGGYKILQASKVENPLEGKNNFSGKKSSGGLFRNGHQQKEQSSSRRETSTRRALRIFPYAVSRNRIEKAIELMNIKSEVVRRFEDADVLLTLKSQEQKGTKKLREMAGNNIPIYTIRSNTVTQVQNFFREYFGIPEQKPESYEETEVDDFEEPEEFNGGGYGREPRNIEKDLKRIEARALKEAEEGAKKVLETSEVVELQPQTSYIRKLQHQLIDKHSLKSGSMGKEPFRRVYIYGNE